MNQGRPLARLSLTAPAADAQDTSSGFTIEDAKAGLKAVTPTLLIVGIFTGAAFAIGSGLVSRYLFSTQRRRR